MPLLDSPTAAGIAQAFASGLAGDIQAEIERQDLEGGPAAELAVALAHYAAESLVLRLGEGPALVSTRKPAGPEGSLEHVARELTATAGPDATRQMRALIETRLRCAVGAVLLRIP